MKPNRNETEQANYINQQVKALNGTGIEGMFVFVFSFPIMPYRESGFDADMTSYALVKSFPSDDPRSKAQPAWEPKEAFFEVADLYSKMAK